MMNTNWREIIQQIPFVDAHCHVMPQAVGKYASGNKPFAGQSRLAGLLLGYGSLLCFLSAGMEWDEINKIKDGTFNIEMSRDAVLRYLPKVETALPVAFCRRGLSLLSGEAVDINYENWMHLEALLEKTGPEYDHLLDAMKRDNISKSVLNMWTGWSASYYGKYDENLSDCDRAKDKKAFVTLATFDSYAIEPFSVATREYARLLGEDAESFCGYDFLIEHLADFFVSKHHARGFKISEAYFRPLDYHPVSRQEARQCFKENPSAQERKTLSNYVTWKIVEQARRLEVPVQIHTGELWGDCSLEQGNPMNLKTILLAFPDVKFDLLHCGYPMMAETGILATNFHNVSVNMAYMPLRSLTQFRQWLDVYCNVVSNDRILLGTDVFDVECMTGCVDMIRDQCALLAEEMDRQQIASRHAIKELFEHLLHRNAETLFRI